MTDDVLYWKVFLRISFHRNKDNPHLLKLLRRTLCSLAVKRQIMYKTGENESKPCAEWSGSGESSLHGLEQPDGVLLLSIRM